MLSLKTLFNLERPVKGVLNGSLAKSDGAAHKSFIIKVFGAEIREEGGEKGRRAGREGGRGFPIFHAYGSCPDSLGRKWGLKNLADTFLRQRDSCQMPGMMRERERNRIANSAR